MMKKLALAPIVLVVYIGLAVFVVPTSWWVQLADWMYGSSNATSYGYDTLASEGRGPMERGGE